MSAWLHLRWMRDTPGNSLIAVRGKRGGWKRESWMTAARQGRRILSKERDREREMAKARERWKREKEREKAILSYASSAPETHRISLSLSLHSTFIFLLLDQHPLPPSPRYLFSLSRRVQPLRTARTPPRANTGQRLLRVSPSPLDLHDLHESPPGSNCL